MFCQRLRGFYSADNISTDVFSVIWDIILVNSQLDSLHQYGVLIPIYKAMKCYNMLHRQLYV